MKNNNRHIGNVALLKVGESPREEVSASVGPEEHFLCLDRPSLLQCGSEGCSIVKIYVNNVKHQVTSIPFNLFILTLNKPPQTFTVKVLRIMLGEM